MTNTKQTKKYEDMNNEEKAQVIYDMILREQPVSGLPGILISLSEEYADGDEIFTVDEWLEYAGDADLSEIIKIAHDSKDLDIDNKYIREDIYYYGYKTSDNILDLIDEYEAVEWIARALDDELSYVECYDTMMRTHLD